MPSQIEITFAGQTLLLDAMGVLYWPDQQLLVASDLHLEKSTFLAAHGSLVPPYDTLDTLERLERAVIHYGPRELLLLGDSFHDRHAWARLDDTLRSRIQSITARVHRTSWIEGNHDIALQGAQPVTLQMSQLVRNILFSHEQEPATDHQIIGHFHPKTSITVQGKRVRGKCFVQTEKLLIMPAFGSYTGGLDLTHPAFAALTGGATLQPYLLHQKSIHRLPPFKGLHTLSL